MQVIVKENENKLWVGSPKLERIMGIENGMVVLRSRNKKLLNKLIATALLRNYSPGTQTFYIYSKPFNPKSEFISKIGQDLGLTTDLLMNTVNFVNLSTSSPMKIAEQWSRIAVGAENPRLIVLDSVGHNTGRDSYMTEQISEFCYQNNVLALIVDSSGQTDASLEKTASVIVDLDIRGEGIEVFLKKHPLMPQTVFLMSP